MAKELERGENTGLIPPKPRPLDFIAGAETGIAYEVRVADGNWEPHKPTDERQARTKVEAGLLNYDSNSCTNFSCMNSIEMQIQMMLDTHTLPENIRVRMSQMGYFDDNGKVNLSDWFNAIMSGTTKDGNTLQAPWDAARKFGVIPQRMGYEPNDFKKIEDWFDAKRITPAMLAAGEAFLEMFDIKYEWVVLDEVGAWPKFEKHIKQAPLHIATPTCGSWNKGGIVKNCGSYKRLNHATCYIGQNKAAKESDSFHKDLDHYNPFVKKLAWDYHIPFALKGVITVRSNQAPPSPISYRWTRTLKKGMRSEDVVMLQKVLMREVPDVFRATATGYFGDWTFNGVVALQELYAKEILAPIGLKKGTGLVAGQTLKWLNAHYGV